jgi:hypothetical protein
MVIMLARTSLLRSGAGVSGPPNITIGTVSTASNGTLSGTAVSLSDSSETYTNEHCVIFFAWKATSAVLSAAQIEAAGATILAQATTASVGCAIIVSNAAINLADTTLNFTATLSASATNYCWCHTRLSDVIDSTVATDSDTSTTNGATINSTVSAGGIILGATARPTLNVAFTWSGITEQRGIQIGSGVTLSGSFAADVFSGAGTNAVSSTSGSGIVTAVASIR